uniref:Uncharacterized protein n=1 Tax=Cannabis sativa TaxID=3483 RepID=A0A803R8Y7_CANSA
MIILYVKCIFVIIDIYTVLLGLARGCSTVQERVNLSLISHKCKGLAMLVYVRATLDQAGWDLLVMYFVTLILPLKSAREKDL